MALNTTTIRKEKPNGRSAANRGPKPRSLSERAKEWKFDKPKTRPERTYSRERKMQVIMFLLNHRVPDTRLVMPQRRVGQLVEDEPRGEIREDGTVVIYRAPTYAEASKWWQIPTATICSWWDRREKLFEGTGIELSKKAGGGGGDNVETTQQPKPKKKRLHPPSSTA